MSRQKKPHDWPVSAGGSEIRPYRGLHPHRQIIAIRRIQAQ